eukprot:gnl/MRDRNA2_/MRDRNA2_87880_c0_seq1.p1 gnl/MRDRNA2_/MRDRNA2_87880_c0~~gnl/MRDRNA2_/MRDRNA2_87880_c0_seq1.p1  ORF type:complete len:160 (+),score=26.30 gnl/MRDRNA2_/MRDRNA2_87880_c0_seq1:100-579(+)
MDCTPTALALCLLLAGLMFSLQGCEGCKEDVWCLDMSIKVSVWAMHGKDEMKAGVIGDGMAPGNKGVCGQMAAAVESKDPVCLGNWEVEDDCGLAVCHITMKVKAEISEQCPGFAKHVAFGTIQATIQNKIQEEIDKVTGPFPSEWAAKILEVSVTEMQ